MAEEESEVRTLQTKPQARSGHVAVSVGNMMLVWGGFTEVVTEPWLPQERYLPGSAVWVYHMLINKWYCKKTEGKVPSGRSGASVVVVDDTMYVVGGHTHTGNTNSVFSLNLHTWVWDHIDTGDNDSQNMSPRDKFAMWEYKNRIYVFGGFGIPTKQFLNEHGEFYADPGTLTRVRGWNNQLLVLHPGERRWSNPLMSGPAPSPRAAHATVRLGEKVFVFGGRHSTARVNDLHCLDLETQQWSGELSVEGEVPKGRSWHSLTPVSPTHVVLYGGYTQTNSPLADAWLLDTAVLQWTQLLLTSPQPRLWHTAVSTPEHEVLVFGGSVNDILGEEDTEHSDGLILVQPSAHSLLRLCLDATYAHRRLLEAEWTSLPRHLHHMLHLRAAGYKVADEGEETEGGHNAKTCSIS